MESGFRKGMMKMTKREYLDAVNAQVQLGLDELDYNNDFETIDTWAYDSLSYHWPIEKFTLVDAAQIIEEHAKYPSEAHDLWSGLNVDEALKTKAWYSFKQEVIIKLRENLSLADTVATIEKNFYKTTARNQHQREMHPDEKMGD
jgi:hypothetical protein